MRSKLFFSFRNLTTCCLILGVTSFSTACDSTARIFLRLVQFDRIQMLSATPVKAGQNSFGDTVWVPACNGDAERVRVNFNLKSTQRGGDVEDRDLQIRPSVDGSVGDAIGKSRVTLGSTVSTSELSLDLTCAEEHDPEDIGGACSGTNAPTALEEDLTFIDHLNGAGRSDGGKLNPVGVAILIDVSGSTSGTVDNTQLAGALSPVCLEGKPGAFEFDTSTLQQCQSDNANFRFAASSDILQLLNDVDPAIVFAFSEELGVTVACNIPTLDNPDEPTKLLNCYTTDRRLVVGGDGLPSAFSDIIGRGAGRSNLWTAVDQAHQYMQTKGELAKHLIVIADGPDTCNQDSVEYQFCYEFQDFGPEAQEPCGGAVNYSSVRQKIDTYMVGKGAAPNDVHVSFLQFQAKGYPSIDPRMSEIACMTGGHHLFINTNKIAENSPVRRQSFVDAATKLRYSLRGHWGLVADIPSYTGDGAGTLSRGTIGSIEGSMTLGANPMVNIDKTIPFGFGAASADQRLHVVKTCRTDADCGTGAGTDECGVRCDSGTGLCNVPPHGAACAGGICCEGACAAGLTVCSSDTSPLACP
ncbi:MAG: hypothetical protein ACI9WU_004040 [Myxococcota bacterium]|jgi:hypothetical protein